jgi:hypothetical protein
MCTRRLTGCAVRDRVEIRHLDMSFQSWPVTYRLLERVYRHATTSLSVSSLDAVTMRTLDFIAADGEVSVGE